jgi:uncharacterized membrane protein YphA (DoxX/SURF4 family)
VLIARRLVARLAPRVIDAWPAILAIALAVVLTHSGVSHLRDAGDVAQHYRDALGFDAARAVGVAQLLAAGGLCVTATRVMTCAAFAAVLIIAIANQALDGRVDATTAATALVLAWTIAIGWGERRRVPLIRTEG